MVKLNKITQKEVMKALFNSLIFGGLEKEIRKYRIEFEKEFPIPEENYDFDQCLVTQAVLELCCATEKGRGCIEGITNKILLSGRETAFERRSVTLFSVMKNKLQFWH